MRAGFARSQLWYWLRAGVSWAGAGAVIMPGAWWKHRATWAQHGGNVDSSCQGHGGSTELPGLSMVGNVDSSCQGHGGSTEPPGLSMVGNVDSSQLNQHLRQRCSVPWAPVAA